MLGKIFGALVAFLILTIPISVVLLIVSLMPHLIDPKFKATVPFILRQCVSGLNSTTLLAIPMFVFSGVIMAKGGISQKLFNVFAYFFGDRTGGMPCAVVVTCLFYGAISGSAPATTAAVGSMTIPFLVSMGYDMVFCAALVATAGGLGVIIPPSIPFILYCMGSNASIGAIFIAGILPGVFIGLALMIYAIFYCKIKGENKELIHKSVNDLRAKGFLALFKDSVWAIISPIFILGGIYGGFVTPTEAAVVSVIYSLFISLCVYKTATVRGLWDITAEAVCTYAPILFILASAAAFGRVLTLTQAPQNIAIAMGEMFTTKVSMLLAINVFLLFVGMIMDTGPAILILTPIFYPIINKLGIDPIHFGVIMICNLAIGFITPPIGNNLYVASTLTKVPVMTIARRAAPMGVVFLIVLMFITFVPWISLALLGRG